MKKFIPALFYIVSLFVFSFHERWSIMNQNVPGTTNTLFWHVTQWLTFALFLIGSILFGFWFRDNYKAEKFYHDFGEIAVVSILGLVVYVFSLHYLTIPLFYMIAK